MTALVCDLGGTNTRLGVVEDGRLDGASLATFRNDDFATFPDVLKRFLLERGHPSIETVCIALAAVATPDGATLTNRDWDIRRSDVLRVSRARTVHFLNDFQALGLSLARAEELETQVIRQGSASPAHWPRLVLGAGTGFNAAACFIDPKTGVPVVPPAECGHMTLPVEGEEELSLQAALSKGRRRASVERALSGNGLQEIYAWRCRQQGDRPKFATAAEIAAQAVAGVDRNAVDASTFLLRFFGRVCGDLALAFLPTGGIYLSGGVSRSLAPLILSTSTFTDAFLAKGRQSEFMEGFSISLLLDDRAALAGCSAWIGYQQERHCET